MEIKEFKEQFEKHKEKLNEKYKDISILWIEGMTKSDIARKYSLTPQRIGAIFKCIINKFEKWKKEFN